MANNTLSATMRTPRDKPGRASADGLAAPLNASGMKPIFAALRNQTGHDFSGYKTSAVLRHIASRMAQCTVDSLASYVELLRHSPAEVDTLFRALMLGITPFFRDAQALAVMRKHIVPQLFANRSPQTTIRIWIVGCSTGEEAYSLAIVLQEHMQTMQLIFPVQIFASDTDSQAIAIARAGRYPASIAEDVSTDRLARFFTAAPDGKSFRINKVVRDMLVFFEQDLIKDPPFSKIDLISCSNMQVCFGEDLQKKAIPLFHYALKPEGMLFLGSSKGLSSFSNLFEAIDRKARLYQRNSHFAAAFRPVISRSRAAAKRSGAGVTPSSPTPDFSNPAPLRELTERALLQHLAPSAALIDEQGDILYLYGRTGIFLEPCAGETSINNIHKMAREGLRPALRSTLRKAKISKASARSQQVRIQTNEGEMLIHLNVNPVSKTLDANAASSLYLVVMEIAEIQAASTLPQAALPAPGESLQGPALNPDALIAALFQEMRTKDELLHQLQEEMEQSSETLSRAYTLMQAEKEDLQASNEELETSKEELQSSNDELAASNGALHAKLEALSYSHGDLDNLLTLCGVGLIVLDPELRLQRFTPSACKVVNLIPADVGRPIAHLGNNLTGYDGLLSDLHQVLETRVHKVKDVQTTQGDWYNMRIQPYRRSEHTVEGAVISFIEIPQRKYRQHVLHS